jgi:hypothetical protein
VPDPLPGWRALLELADDADPQKILRAARTDIDACARTISSGFEPALRFTVSQSDFGNEEFPELVVEISGPTNRRAIRLSYSVFLAARRKEIGPVGLVASGLVALKPLDSGWWPKPIGQAFPPAEDQLAAHRQIFRHTPAATDVRQFLDSGQDVLVVGDHGSGRSALAANFAENHLDNDRGVIWLNLTDPADGPESIVSTLLQCQQKDAYLLVIDGLHANLPIVHSVFSCVMRLRQDFGIKIQILATSWNSVAELLERGESILQLRRVIVEGRLTIRRMLEELAPSKAVWNELEKLAGNDVHIAASAIAFFKLQNRVPTELELQREYTGGVEDEVERRALYHLACLGLFGLALSEREARNLFGESVVRLRGRALAHRTDDAYTIGPCRRARLVMQHARRYWSRGQYAQPEDIVWQHLQRDGERLIKATLRLIDQIASPDDLRPESRHLLLTWDMLEQLGVWLERQCKTDATWGNNLGAAVFAAMALTRLHRGHLWLGVAGPIRGGWRYDGPDMERPELIGEPTEDFEDFEKIQEAMRVEDSVFGPKGHPSGMPADLFDKMKAYQNWALGLHLGLEGTAPADHREQTRIDDLIAVAGRAQETDGSFYPERVPWVTARVVIGLCQAGLRHDHVTVRKACKWLVDVLVGDSNRAGWWRSGTGSWNSDEATTAMCLTALACAGAPERQVTRDALAWLKDRHDQWTRTGREIDLAQVLETLNLYADSFEEQRLIDLLAAVRGELRRPMPDSNRPEERLRWPFIAAQSADIVWQTVQSECRKLLQDVITSPDDASAAVEADMTSDSSDDPLVVIAAPDERDCGLTERQLTRWNDAADQLRHTLNDQIARRRSVAAVPSVQRILAQLGEQRELYQDLSSQLGRFAPRQVLEHFDTLGRDVCGPAWPSLPFPNIYCDEASA